LGDKKNHARIPWVKQRGVRIEAIIQTNEVFSHGNEKSPFFDRPVTPRAQI
jgi:hypothetical protein